MTIKTFFLLLLFCIAGIGPARAQMSVADSLTAAQLVQRLVGQGIIVLNPVLTCPGVASGTFSISGTHNLGIDSGIILTSGKVVTGQNSLGVNGPKTPSTTTGPSHASRGDTFDVDLKRLVDTFALRDVCKLEFDFIPTGNSLNFDYVFGSSEYRDFSCSRYNDVFGFFISGPGFSGPTNIATIPGTSIPVAVNSTTNPSINIPTSSLLPCTNMGPGSPFAQLYVDNNVGSVVTYWGFTKVLTAKANVQSCKLYHIKMAIADCSDVVLDSGVFLKAGGFASDSTLPHIVWDTAFCYMEPFPDLTLTARSGYAGQTWDDSSKNVTRIVNAPGIYWVTYDFCTLRADTFKINAYPAPAPFNLGIDTSICEGSTHLVLTAPTGPYTYLWQDADTARTYPAKLAGTYSVTITRNGHCSASDTIVVSTRKCDCFAITANAFTPNGDGLNDRFMPRISPDCVPAKNFALRIYDRWGQQVYATYSATDKGWDGTYHGKPSDMGSYFYELKFTGREDGAEVYQKGDVTLVR